MATIEEKTESDQPANKKEPAPSSCSVDFTTSPGPITNEELSRISELGLGRGVDATDPSPWSSKSSFQVRYVTLDGIITTNEGGALQMYEREIESLTTVQTSLKASISAPTHAPIDLHLEGEFSRSISSTRKAIGKQVINRTISFRADFNDVPQDAPKDSQDTNTGSVIRDLYTRGNSTLPVAHYTFEQRLAEWIMDRVVQRRESDLDSAQTQIGGDDTDATQLLKIKGVEPMKDLAHFLKTANKEGRESIFDDCVSFVRHFRITHYVSAIQLGASQYRVLSENEYYMKINTEGAFGFDAVAKLLSSATYTKKTTFKASDTRQVGEIINDKVKRGSDDEAVVGIKIQPIHSLVKLRYLHLALQQALEVYIEEQRDTTSGPYLIACGAKSNIFWKVNCDEDTYSIGATTDLNQASLFYILPDDDGKHVYEFRIGWKISISRERLIKRTKSILHPGRASDLEPLCRYLDAKINITGRNPGPLQLKSGVDNSYCRLTLHSRLIGKTKAPIDTKVWASGKEEFFVSCARRRLKMAGYIAVKRAFEGRERSSRQTDERYTTACVPKQTCHNERDTWMLFRLLPAEFILSHHQDIEGEKEALGEKVPKRQETGGAGSTDKTSASTSSKREHVEMQELHATQC